MTQLTKTETEESMGITCFLLRDWPRNRIRNNHHYVNERFSIESKAHLSLNTVSS